MLQLKDLPTAAVLDKFSHRYPQADISAVSSFLHLLRVASDLSLALDACLSRHGLLQGRWWVLILLMREEQCVSLPSVLAEVRQYWDELDGVSATEVIQARQLH